MGIIHKATFIPRFIRQAFYKPFNKLMFWSADVKFGKNMKVYNRFYLKKYSGAEFIIGDNFLVNSGEAINPIYRNIRGSIYVNTGGKLRIGDNVAMSSPHIRCNTIVTIGNNVKMGALVTILDTDSHHVNYLDRRNETKYNSDGVVSAVDVNLCVEFLLKGEAPDFNADAADMNNSGGVDEADVTAIINKILNP